MDKTHYEQLTAKLLDAAREEVTEEPSENFGDVIAEISAANLNKQEYGELFHTISSRFTEMDNPVGVGRIARWLGGGVEAGVEVQNSSQNLWDYFYKWAEQASALVSKDEEDNIDPQIVLGLELMGQSLVSHLAVDETLRETLSKRDDVLETLYLAGYVSAGCEWVLGMLERSSGDILVIHATHNKGFRVRFENISNCFHLFSLLQGALEGQMPEAKKASSRVLTVAQGKDFEKVIDKGWWFYGLASSKDGVNLSHMADGGMHPADLPQVNGERILLLWPPQIPDRTWGEDFFTPILQVVSSQVSIKEQLSQDDLEHWHKQLELPPPGTLMHSKKYRRYEPPAYEKLPRDKKLPLPGFLSSLLKRLFQ